MYYNDITIFEINKRIDFLTRARNDISAYFENLERNSLYGISENKIAEKKRKDINLYLKKLQKYVTLAGINSVFCYSPPPAFGGLAGNIDLLANIFLLNRYGISSSFITDIVDQASGIYNGEKTKAVLRYINPIWWFWKIVKRITNIPFWVFRESGFNTSKFESGLFGKFIKLAFNFTILLSALVPILHEPGYERIFSFIKSAAV